MGPDGATWKKFFTAEGVPYWDKPGHQIPTWAEPQEWSPAQEFHYPWKQYVTANGDFYYKKQGSDAAQWHCPRDYVAPYPAPAGTF